MHREEERQQERVLLHHLIHFPGENNGQDLARLKAGARSFSRVFHMDVRGPPKYLNHSPLLFAVTLAESRIGSRTVRLCTLVPSQFQQLRLLKKSEKEENKIIEVGGRML